MSGHQLPSRPSLTAGRSSSDRPWTPDTASTSSLHPPPPHQHRRRRISDRAISLLRIGGNRRRASRDGASESASITSGRSDVTPRESVDVTPSQEGRPLSYQPRIRPSPAAAATAAASREAPQRPVSAQVLRAPQRPAPSQSAQVESSLHARLQALLHDGHPAEQIPSTASDRSAAHSSGPPPSAAAPVPLQDSHAVGRPVDAAQPEADAAQPVSAAAASSGLSARIRQRRSQAALRASRANSYADEGAHPVPSPSAVGRPLQKKQKVRRGAVPVVPSLALSAAVAAKASAVGLCDPPPSVTSPTESRTSTAPSRSSSLAATTNDAVSPSTEASSPDIPSARPQVQRPNIKVRIVTWNMHDSLPKGDLEVLLGRAGVYVPPEDDWDIAAESDADDDNEDRDAAHHEQGLDLEAPEASQGEASKPVDDAARQKEAIPTSKRKRGQHVVGQEATPRKDRIPPLPHDDNHPYHLLVVAGQECPWGDGKRLATGVGLAGELGDIGKQKARAAKEKEREAKEREKEKSKDKAKDKGAAVLSPAGQTTAIDGASEAAAAGTGQRERTESGSDQQGFPFHSMSQAQPAYLGAPLLSPLIGGTDAARFGGPPPALSNAPPPTPGAAALIEGVGEKVSSAANGIAGSWTGLGGKGWSDMCEDWFCRGPSTVGKEKDRALLSGALLARALSHSPSKKDLVNGDRRNKFLAQSQPGTPDLSRAASPDPVWSLPSTPGPSTPQMQAADLQTGAAANVQSPRGASRGGKKDVPKLRLKVDSLASPNRGAGAGPIVQSPVDAAQAASRPRSPLSMPRVELASPTRTEGSQQGSGPPVAGHSNNLLSVPAAPAFHRSGSSSSVASLDAGSRPEAVSRPLPFRSPSPAVYPAEAPRSDSADSSLGFLGPPAAPAMSSSPSSERLAALARQHGIPPLGADVATMPDGTPKALGPYELVIKERMMGCYMAVYVWRGCRDRVRGASRSHVKSGLLSGRVGNKGGVGISIKLGATRLLFVNAHLAAHEGRVAVRLANVAKIKAALKVDSFLPPDDPRSKLEDITEQFDHCFWFGDLNFRIDITRSHADWLMMNKRYDQALAFDQLGKVLSEGKEFIGFDEAPIDFPPTYKYDVLKTLKPKRKKTVTDRILHRRAGSKSGGEIFFPLTESSAETRDAQQAAHDPAACDVALTEDDGAADHSGTEDAATASGGGKATVPSPSWSSEGKLAAPIAPPQSPGAPVRRVSRRAKAAQIKGNKAAAAAMSPSPSGPDLAAFTDDDTSSISSSAWDSVGSSSGFATNFAEITRQGTTLSEAEQQRIVEENTHAAQGRKLFSSGARVRAKFRILEFVKTATGQKGSPSGSDPKPSSSNDSDGPQQISRQSATEAGATAHGYIPAEPLAISGLQRQQSSASSSNHQRRLSGSGLSHSSQSPPRSSAGVFGTSYRSQLSSSGGHGVPSGSVEAVGRQGSANTGAVVKAEGSNAADTDKRRLTRASSQSTQLSRSTSNAHSFASEQLATTQEQPYDTSAKQRVPSWCDRVLFRSTVPVEDDSEDEDEDEDGSDGTGNFLSRRHRSRSNHEGLGSRVGTALSNALFAPLKQAAERRQASRQASTSSALMAAAAATSSITFAEPEQLAAKPADPSLRVPARQRSVSHSVDASALSHSPDKSKSSQQLLHRLLHPRSRSSKKLKPSRTIEAPSSSMTLRTPESPPAFGSHYKKAISAVDLPWQAHERKREFDLASPSSDRSHLLPSLPSPLLAVPGGGGGGPRSNATSSNGATPSSEASVPNTQGGPSSKDTASNDASRGSPRLSAVRKSGRPGSSHSAHSSSSPRESRPAVISKLSWKSSPTSEAHGADGPLYGGAGPRSGSPSRLVGGSPRTSSSHPRRSGSPRRPRDKRAGSEASVASATSAPNRHRHQPSTSTPLSKHVRAPDSPPPAGTAAADRDGLASPPRQFERAVTDGGSPIGTGGPQGPSRLSGSWWMDHLSQHLPSFFAPALTALRSGHDDAERATDADAGDGEGHSDGASPPVELVGPRKGRIECLLYKSLDDREMRILEGRSDHRPVIFVGAIGI